MYPFHFNLGRSIIWLTGSLMLLIGGCFTRETEIGPPEIIGNFSIRKVHVVHLNDTGNRESDIYEISHGRLWHTKLGLPPHDWTSFTRITRLLSPSPAWLVETPNDAGFITESDNAPVVQLLWRGDYDTRIQQISEAYWHIPDYVRTARLPDDVYTGGRLFDAKTLTQRMLPNQPPGGPHKFLSLSRDAEAVAWLKRMCRQDERCTYTVATSDKLGPNERTLPIDDDLLKRQPFPNGDPNGPNWQGWFSKVIKWELDPKGRWGVSFSADPPRRTAMPNPSIERTSQGLRPCAASHVKR